jgi:ATP-dependent Lon protease
MRDYREAKAMARRLREALAERGAHFPHSECLELVARSFGLKDWHVLSALVAEADAPAPPEPQPPPLPAAAWSGPVVMLRDVVAFPKLTFPLFVGREASKRALQRAYGGEQELLLVAQRDRDEDRPGREGLYDVGVVADVMERTVLPDGSVKLLVRGHQRARLASLTVGDDGAFAEATLIPGAPTDYPGAPAEAAAAIAAFDAYAGASDGRIGDSVRGWIAGVTHPGMLADLIAAHAAGPLYAKQAILELLDPRRRLAAAVALLGAADARAA